MASNMKCVDSCHWTQTTIIRLPFTPLQFKMNFYSFSIEYYSFFFYILHFYSVLSTQKCIKLHLIYAFQ